MSPTATRSAQGLGNGDHACLIFDQPDDARRVAAGYVADGLAAGDRVCYLAGSDGAEATTSWLAAEGIDPAGAIRRDQLVVLPAQRSYLAADTFDPAGMIETVGALLDGALSDGLRGLRLAGELGWTTRGDRPRIEMDALLDFERRVTTALDGQPASALCQFERAAYTEAERRAIRSAHPVHMKQGSGTLMIAASGNGRELRLSGEVDFTDRDALGDALTAVPGDGTCTVQLSELEFIDVAGSTALVQFATHRGGVVLYDPPSSLRRFIDVCFPNADLDIR